MEDPSVKVNDLSHLNEILDEMKILVDHLNQVADDTGDIHINDPLIWDRHLHVWSHYDIIKILEVFNEIERADPLMLDDEMERHVNKMTNWMMQGVAQNKKAKMLGKPTIRNILDTEYKGEKKRDYWLFTMHIREIWNNVTGEDHPLWAKTSNKKTKAKPHKMDKTTVFTSKLFTRKKDDEE